MKIAASLLAGAPLALALWVLPASAFAEKVLGETSHVGGLKNVTAVLQDTPDPSPATLLVRGIVTAPDPCHVATAEAVGEADSETGGAGAVLKVKVVTARGSEEQVCAQELTDMPFKFSQEVGLREYEQVEVSSGAESERVHIGVAE
ncbi:hypothetical protein [Afifella sp. IM 167]|uniref:hypothetical protein n=1 Tax=Afifella sp. IM 167 TaxID=2033586 RepID=UPI001CC93BDD|nr:hypothetical protein [Afifella sp. IM 167]MBZ8133950.1 hypothetical protein [Afifella sp. IM 167]